MDKLYATDKLTGSHQSAATAGLDFVGIDLQDKQTTHAFIPEQTISPLPEISSPLNSGFNQLIKSVFDISLSFILIITILSWLIPLLALLIKLDSRGPVFFLQKRTGAGGKAFSCIKFRSMFVNNDAHILPAQENDPRITQLGKTLRKYHLDELPQLLNVFMGDMSMVGPRPHMLQENQQYENMIEAYSLRHTVKPGITGLAQSMGNFGATYDMASLKERTTFDIEYIQTWSLRKDLLILWRTIRMMASH